MELKIGYLVLGILGLLCRVLWSLFTSDQLISKRFGDAYLWAWIFISFAISATSHFYGDQVAIDIFGVPLGILVFIIPIWIFISSLKNQSNSSTIPLSSSHYEPTMKEKQLEEMEKLSDVGEKQLEQVEKLRKEVEDLKWELERDRRYRNR